MEGRASEVRLVMAHARQREEQYEAVLATASEYLADEARTLREQLTSVRAELGGVVEKPQRPEDRLIATLLKILDHHVWVLQDTTLLLASNEEGAAQ